MEAAGFALKHLVNKAGYKFAYRNLPHTVIAE